MQADVDPFESTDRAHTLIWVQPSLTDIFPGINTIPFTMFHASNIFDSTLSFFQGFWGYM